MENILDNIETIRRNKGIKQAVIAEALGVKQPAYSIYITRNSDIYFNRLSQIANILGVPVIDIITYPDKYVPESAIPATNLAKNNSQICFGDGKIYNMSNSLKELPEETAEQYCKRIIRTANEHTEFLLAIIKRKDDVLDMKDDQIKELSKHLQAARERIDELTNILIKKLKQSHDKKILISVLILFLIGL